MDKKIVYLPVSQLHPHPDNPRKEIGDVTELAESIKVSGILQNLTVVKHYADTGNWDESYGYKVIIGHRRLEASKLAGLETVPCVVIEMTEKEQLSTMLVENMQRSDLTVFEQAQGFQLMLNLGSTVEQIAKESGFSVSTVRRRIKMTELDQDVLKEVSSRQLSLGDFDKLAQIEDIEERNRCLSKIGTSDFNQAVTRQIRTQEIKRKLPLVMQDLKDANVQLIEFRDTYSGEYDPMGSDFSTNVQSWKGKASIPDGKGKDVYAFVDKSWGDIRFLIKASKPKRQKERKSQEQIDKEMHLAEVWKRTTALNEETRQLRKAFVDSLTVTKRNEPLMLRGAVIASVVSTNIYHGLDRDLLRKIIGASNDMSKDQVSLKVEEWIRDEKTSDYPKAIYASFGDYKGASMLTYTTDYQKFFPEHRQNVLLDWLYDWLISLGYEMSADEKAMRDGTHEIFKSSL